MYLNRSDIHKYAIDMGEDACSHAGRHELSQDPQSSSPPHVSSSSPPPPWSGNTGAGSQPPAQGN